VCVPGAGGFPSICNTIREAVQEQQVNLQVEPFEWTHGYLRVIADHVDYAHARAEGERLAGQVCALKQSHPGLPISLLSHSAGCAVTLAATEYLPPGSLNRIILLAPAVSATYDLQPALRCVCRSVEVFYSGRDVAALGLGTTLLGTSDRRWEAAAGRVGFRPPLDCAEEQALLTKLHQHPWHPCLAWAGNAGGHYGAYQPTYLRAYVLPLLIE
jgi:hypothetical protein